MYKSNSKIINIKKKFPLEIDFGNNQFYWYTHETTEQGIHEK